VIDSMQHRDDFCDALRNIVGCDSASVSEHSLDEEPRSSGSERPIHDVFFGKPANREQLRIAQAVDRHGSVLVQGPPGTGKSHTIANLIGHLLAHGQSVLVTSHTTKALRVLREHLVEELRPLCVSVLESDLESRRQLEESVQAISSRLSESDADELEREAKGLEQRRACLIAELGLRREELKNARADEYRSVVYGGNEIAPLEAARIVAAGTGRHDWVPGPVALGEPCPLSAAEVRELYETNASTRPGDDRYVDRSLPDQLPVPGDVARWFQQSDQLAECGQLDRRHWPKVGFKPGHIGQLESLITELKTTVQEFAAFDGWKLAAVDARRHPQPDGGPWDHLLRKIDETVELALQVQTDVVVHRPQVSEESPLQAQSVLALEIHEHLLRGGRLGWLWLPWRLHWKKALSIWTVQGRPPKTADQVAAILRLLAVKISRTELQVLWEGLMAAHGAPGLAELGEEPERAASQFASIIREVLDWWPRRWTPLEQRLRDIGFEWQRFVGEQPPDLSRYGELRRIMTAVQNRLIGDLERTKKHLESLRVRKQMTDLLNHLGMSDRPEVVAVRKAIEDKDPEAYSRAYHECMAAVARRKHALRRKELLARLRRNGSAETWAEAILHRHDLHCGSTPPGDVFKAWEWRQLNDELVRRAEVDLEELGRQIEDLQDQLKSVTNQLIDRKAWAGQVRRTRRAQRQALIGWLSIINRIGKGFGRRVPQLRREAQQKMEECREAVPVWVMPLSRLVENFDFSAPRFDVVIIDEASQCDVMALMALAIARKVVVVGDDKQVSPVAVGQQLDIVGNLIRLHLEGIPNAVLYDGRMSIYDLAKQSFPGLICLMEHFRCVPDIIQFSNHLSYEGTIKPLREKASSQLTPHVVPYRVEGATRGSGKVNAEEAAVVATLIVAACEHEAYVKQTFGVISLVGDEQAMEIERLLLQHLLPDEYERRRIICGNSAQFQGDERDVMFLSMVQSPGSGPLPMLDRPDFQQRYNVAASRARNQMWVVYSLNHEVDLKPGDLRRRLVEHALDPEAITRDLERAGIPAESPFEQQVYERLVRRGYRVRPQWPVGRYRIDLVVEGAERRAAVECDGDRDHPIEKLSEDMERQAILERLGWRFIRIRGSVFFRNPDTAIDKLVAKLNELGIHPERRELHVEAEVEAHRPNLVAEIIRRAAELRLLWKTPDSLIPREKIPHVTDL
jgi:very-short-patch-repair endonuclease